MKKVRLQDVFDQLPMGLGAYAPMLIQQHLPELADELLTPLKGITIEFETGEGIQVSVAQLLGGDDGEVRDNRPGLEAGGESLPGAPGLAR